MPCGIDHGLFDLCDARARRPCGQIVLEFVNALRRTFRPNFNAAGLQISDVSEYAVTCRRTLSKIPIADALNAAPDDEVLRGMERDLNGDYIPYSEGGRRTDALYSERELAALWALVGQRIEGMARQLYSGNIAALPCCRGDEAPCDFCDYRTACGFEPGDPVREILKLDRADILKGEDSTDGD